MFLMWTGNEFQAAGPATVNELSAKSSKIVKDFAFCKQPVMYHHVKSINSVIAINA